MWLPQAHACMQVSPESVLNWHACAQYTEFLGGVLPPAQYAALLPPLSALVNDYGVDPEVAFQVCGCHPDRCRRLF